MRLKQLTLIGGLLAAAATPAFAQDRPVMIPTRDVSVTYRISTQPPADMRMSWLVAEQKLRVDMPGGIGWSLVDQRSQKMTMVMEQQRMIMQMPTQPGAGGVNLPTQPPDTARFTRGAAATVAGTPCTIWGYEDTATGAKGESCLTADGVMLRSTGTHGGQTGTLEATQVTYGAQDPARFRVPAGYQSMQMPTQPATPPGAAPGGATRPAR